jgi:hypothetical protein
MELVVVVEAEDVEDMAMNLRLFVPLYRFEIYKDKYKLLQEIFTNLIYT